MAESSPAMTGGDGPCHAVPYVNLSGGWYYSSQVSQILRTAIDPNVLDNDRLPNADLTLTESHQP